MSTAQKTTDVTKLAEHKPRPISFVLPGGRYTDRQVEYINATGGPPWSHDTAVRIIGQTERELHRQNERLAISREEFAAARRRIGRLVNEIAGLKKEAVRRTGRMCQCTRVEVLTDDEAVIRDRLVLVTDLMGCVHCDGNGLLPKPHGNKKVEGSDADQG